MMSHPDSGFIRRRIFIVQDKFTMETIVARQTVKRVNVDYSANENVRHFVHRNRNPIQSESDWVD
jgi:hypothetical protein